MLVAARHPHMVDRLVMVEASPEGPSPEAVERARRWFEKWPQPMRDFEEASEFFGTTAPAWLAGMEQRGDGWWPRFDNDIMLGTLAAAGGGWWNEWSAVRCPTLLVLGEKGWIGAEAGDRMRESSPQLRVVTVRDAGHDVHLDAPAELTRSISDFLG